MVPDQVLVFQKAVEHVPGESQIHSALPVIQSLIFGEGAADQFFGRNVQVEDGVRGQCEAVEIFDPIFFLPSDDVAHHERVDIAIGQHHASGF